MDGSSGENGDGDRKPVGLVVRLAYPTLEEFRVRFAPNLSRGGVFIRTRDPRAVGTPLRFELRIASGETVLRGEGKVRWVDAEDLSAKPPRVPGMGVQFSRLDESSRQLVDQIVAGGAARPSGAFSLAGPLVTPLNVTPTLKRLAPLTPAAPTNPGTPERPRRIDALRPSAVRVTLPLPPAPRPITRPSRAVVGIDFGTTSSRVAIVEGGHARVLASREGQKALPSMVALTSRASVVAGLLARAQLLSHPAQTIVGAKRLIGRSFDSATLDQHRGRFPFELVADGEGQAAVQLGPLTVTLEQVAALVLQELKQVAQDQLGEEVNRAVLTVPASWGERQRQALRHAAALAGLQVERILNEATAAALAYGFGRHLRQRVLVYDLGGGTFEATVLELRDDVYQVVATGGDPYLGGDDFDGRLTETLLSRYQAQVGVPFAGDRVAFSRLVDAAERAKCALSDREEFQVQLPFLSLHEGHPVTFEANLTRAELERLVEPLVDRTIEICAEVLAAKGLAAADVDEVILVGGQARTPLVERKLSAFLGHAPNRAVQPEEAVALGAALLGHSLGGAEAVVLREVAAASIGVALPDGSVRTIIEKDSSLPATKQYGLSTSRDGQTEFELLVVEGEGVRAADCEYLGAVRLDGLPPGPRGVVKIAVTFELGIESLLTVTARDFSSGRKVSAQLRTGGGRSALGRKLADGASGEAASDLATGVHALASPTPIPTPPPGGAPPGSERLLGKLRRLLGGDPE